MKDKNAFEAGGNSPTVVVKVSESGTHPDGSRYDTKAGTEVPALFVETVATGALTSLHHKSGLPPV